MGDSGVWRGLETTIKAQFPNVRASSTYRAGDDGYHGSGDAIDIAPPSMEVFNWIAANYPQSAEIIYTPAGGRQIKNGAPHTYSAGVAADHFDHIHWANPAGGAPTGAPSSGGGSSFGGITSFLSFLTNTSMWARVGVGIGAVIILLIALARLTGGKVDGMRAIKKAAKAVPSGR